MSDDMETTSLPTLPERFQVFDLRAMLQPRPPMQWAVAGLVPATGLTVFYGDSGAKKTWSCLHLAACLACGIEWLGMHTKPGPVLIVDEESGITRLASRMQQILRAFNLTDQSESLPVISATCSNGIDIKRKADADALYQRIIQTGARYVIVDSLSRIMTGDENSKEDVQPAMSTLARLAQLTETAFIVIHHANKGGGYRGSTAIRATVDTFVKVESADDSPTVTFTAEKVRDGESRKFAALAEWDAENDIFSLTATAPLAEQHRADERVLAVLRERRHATRKELAQCTGYSENTISKSITRLKDADAIRRANAPGRAIEAVFTVNDQAAMAA